MSLKGQEHLSEIQLWSSEGELWMQLDQISLPTQEGEGVERGMFLICVFLNCS